MLNKQVRILPSAVTRIRLQCPQNGSLTGLMKPFDLEVWYGERVAVLLCGANTGAVDFDRPGT